MLNKRIWNAMTMGIMIPRYATGGKEGCGSLTFLGREERSLDGIRNSYNLAFG